MCPTSLETLSNELLIEIFLFIRGPLTSAVWSTSSYLANISLCSRRLHQLVEPILYSKFLFWDDSNTSVAAHLRTLLDRPHLSSYVKFLDCPYMRDYLDLSSLTEDYCAKIRMLLPDEIYGQEFCDEWYREICPRRTEDWSLDWSDWEGDNALAALLLVMFSKNLQTIEFVPFGSYVHGDVWVKRVLHEAAVNQRTFSTPTALSNLTEVHLLGDRENGYFLLSSVLPYFELPSVKDIEVRATSDYTQQESLLDEVSSPGNFGVSKVAFRDSQLESKHIRPVLSRFCALTFFEYEIGNSLIDSSDVCILPAINAGLANSKHCLETLSVIHAQVTRLGGRWYRSLDPIQFQGIGSLAEFGALRSLKIDAIIMIGIEQDRSDLLGESLARDNGSRSVYTGEQSSAFIRALPKSLRNLAITECSLAITDCMPMLIPEVDHSMPLNLEKLVLSFQDISPDHSVWSFWKNRALEHGVAMAPLRSNDIFEIFE